MRAKIGDPRIYDGPGIPLLYPGERATSAGIPFERLLDALGQDGCLTVEPWQWIVEPEPARRGAYLRWRYRLICQWLDRFSDWR